MTLPNDGAPKAHTIFAFIETWLHIFTLDELPKINKVDNKSVTAKNCLNVTFEHTINTVKDNNRKSLGNNRYTNEKETATH